jgi:hypothetical protein
MKKVADRNVRVRGHVCENGMEVFIKEISEPTLEKLSMAVPITPIAIRTDKSDVNSSGSELLTDSVTSFLYSFCCLSRVCRDNMQGETLLSAIQWLIGNDERIIHSTNRDRPT